MWKWTCPHVVFCQRPRQPQLAFTERSNSCMKDWNPKTSFLFPDLKNIYIQIWTNLFPYFIRKEPISIYLAYSPNLFSSPTPGQGWAGSPPTHLLLEKQVTSTNLRKGGERNYEIKTLREAAHSHFILCILCATALCQGSVPSRCIFHMWTISCHF